MTCSGDEEAVASVSTQSLCFLDAAVARKDRKISWDEYLGHLLSHFNGVKHEEGDIQGTYPPLRTKDPFAYGMFCWNRRFQPKVNDISAFEHVFPAYREGDVNKTRGMLQAFNEKHGNYIKDMRRQLAFLALQERRARMLQLCFDQGNFPYEAYFVDEADAVDEKTDPETYQVVEQSHMRKLYPPLPPGPLKSSATGHRGEATFDRGGLLPVDW